MTILITGNGHCGTTFLARLLMEVGCDFGQGDPPAPWTEGAQAMEHPVIQRKVYEVTQQIEHGVLLPRGFLEGAIRRFPPYLKAPAIGWHLDLWLAAGFRPDAVIVCHRSIEATLKSILRVGGGYGGFGPLRNDDASRQRLYTQAGRLMSAIWDHGIPHAILEFPYTVTAPAWITCGDLVESLEPLELGFTCEEFCAAHARLARPDLVHVR